MAITRPTGEQLRFASANTGEHILDTYMEAAEIGGRALSDLLDDLFDPADSGKFRSENFEFRYNSDKLQFRAGIFSNSSASWVDVTTFFSIEGAFSTSTAYNNFDLVTVANSDVYIVYGLSSAQTYGSESAFISSSNTKKIVDVSGAQAQAAIASDHRADAAKYAVTAEDATFSLTSTNGGTSGLYSAKHYQAKASANATTATSQATISSNHRADAAKYTSTAHNTTFTLTSTNGGTSGLYSALHYATESSNSATAASTSETNAASSATSASGSASTATTQANTATTKASEATSSASTASTHAGTATTKAGEASASATSASGSATTATTQATTATTQAGLSSDHRADAAKYAVTNHNTTFSLTSTNGGTSGLYSAKHYATEASTSATNAASSATSATSSASTATTKANEASASATAASNSATASANSATASANSATAAQNTADAIGTFNSLSDVVISSVGNLELIQYDTTTSKFINRTATEAGIATITYVDSQVASENTIDEMNDTTITSVGDNEILQYDNSTSKWINQTLAEAGILTSETSHADVVVDGDFGSNGIMTRTGAGSYAMLTDNSSNWNTAYGWGNHASSGYVTYLGTAIVDADFSANSGLMKKTSAGSYTIVSDSSSNWNTAYGWGNHASAGYATLASPTLTGNPLAPTQSAGDNSTKIATTAYADTAVSNLVDSAPSALNTLNELAAALGDDANFSTTVTNSIATKMPLAGGTFTGGITGTTATFSDNITSRKAGDVELTVHADSASGPESALLLMRGTNDTFGGDGYNDWKIENGYGKSGSAGGTLRIQRGYNSSLDTYWEWDANGNASSYANITSSGTLNISGATGTAQLQVNLTDTTAYNHSIKCYNPNLTQGQHNQIHLGESGSNYNTSALSYVWDSDGSASNNYLEIGHWGNGDLIKVYGDKVEITDPLTVTSDVTFTGDNYNVTWDKSEDALKFPDGAELRFGTGDDLVIKQDSNGTHSRIIESGSGNFVIQAENFNLKNSNAGKTFMKCKADAEVELFHNNEQKLETTSTGVVVTGDVETSGNIELGHASDTTISRDSAGVVKINTDKVLTTGNSDAPTTTSSSGDADFVLVDDGGTMKKITPADLGITSGGASQGFAIAMAICL